MKRIIVPTDFSDLAWNATIHALEYCVIFKAQLQLIHIYDYSSSELNTNYQDVVETIYSEEETMKELLEKISNMDAYDSIEVAGNCLGGKLSDNLQNMVNGEEDIVVIGSEGRSGIMGKLFGSNTTRLIKGINCPILIIPPNFEFSINTPITCAIDQNTTIKTFDLTLLGKLAIIDKESLFKVVHIVEESKNALLLEQFKNIKLKYDELVGNNISALLEKYTNFNESRMLVLIRKEKGFFENIFRMGTLNNMAINSKIPLLILNEEP